MSSTGTGTNGSQATPSRDEVIRLSSYYAAVENYFDTSEVSQKAGLLAISVVDMAPEALPPGTTHRFYVMIERIGSLVTRYSDNRYEVTPHNQTEDQLQEHKLRDAVLDYALWYLTGEGAGYQLDPRPQERTKARAAMIKELLADRPEEEHEDSDPRPHAVVREKLPDMTVSLAPGAEGGPMPHPLRQWSVEIGPYYSCEVALFGYEEDDSPVLVAFDTEPEGEEPENYEEDEEEEEEEEDDQ
jgi:hypothetical protein